MSRSNANVLVRHAVGVAVSVVDAHQHLVALDHLAEDRVLAVELRQFVTERQVELRANHGPNRAASLRLDGGA